MITPRRPTAESPINLQWAWDVCDAIRERTPLSFIGLRATLSPNGFALSSLSRPVGPESAARKAFEIKELTAEAVTVTRCWYMRGSVSVFSADEPSAAISGLSIIVSAKIHKSTGVVTLEAGSAPYDSSPNSSAEFYRRPLYCLKRTSAESAWFVYDDYRSMLSVGLYE